jgi:hypothetical protein
MRVSDHVFGPLFLITGPVIRLLKTERISDAGFADDLVFVRMIVFTVSAALHIFDRRFKLLNLIFKGLDLFPVVYSQLL